MGLLSYQRVFLLPLRNRSVRNVRLGRFAFCHSHILFSILHVVINIISRQIPRHMMATQKYLNQALQLATMALQYAESLTPRQRRTFRRFLKDSNLGHEINQKQITRVLRHCIKAHHHLTPKVSGPVCNTAVEKLG
jgi:hypothetical protein